MYDILKSNNLSKYFQEKSYFFIATFLFSYFLFLFIRNNSAVYLGVLDEYYYNLYARLLPFSEAKYGNFLYYLIYRGTNFCGDGFLSCVYLFNIIFYLGAFFPIYAIARQYCTPLQGLWLSCLTVLSPINNMTAYFMPESLYFLIFWILIWLVINNNFPATTKNKYILWGLVVAILSLIKVHGLFLVPAIIVYIIYQSIANDKFNKKNVVINISLFIATIIFIRFTVGFLLAGKNGITLFGYYGGMIDHAIDLFSENSIDESSSLGNSKSNSLEILRRDGLKIILFNILPIILFYAPVIAVIFLGLCDLLNQIKSKEKIDSGSGNLSILSIVVVTSLVSIITIAHLVMVARGISGFQLFWRYYEFTFPLIVLTAAALLKDQRISNAYSKKIITVFSIFLVGICVYALSLNAGNHWINIEISKFKYYGVGTLIIISLIVAIISLKVATRIYIWLILPLIILFSNIAIYQELKITRIQPNESAISKFINSRIGRDQLDKLVVIMNNQTDDLELAKFMMNINHAPIQVIKSPGTEREVNTSLIPNGKDWTLLIGNHLLTGKKLDEPHQDLLIFGDMTLFGGHGKMKIDLGKSNWTKIIKRQSGLFDPPEPWGAWSIQKEINFEFKKPLPRKFNLYLDARAFGPNLKNDFHLIMGNETIPFNVETFPEFSRIKLLVNNYSKLSSFSIIIPKPISPKEMNQGNDERKLGIGIKQIAIEW